MHDFKYELGDITKNSEEITRVEFVKKYSFRYIIHLLLMTNKLDYWVIGRQINVSVGVKIQFQISVFEIIQIQTSYQPFHLNGLCACVYVCECMYFPL